MLYNHLDPEPPMPTAKQRDEVARRARRVKRRRRCVWLSLAAICGTATVILAVVGLGFHGTTQDVHSVGTTTAPAADDSIIPTTTISPSPTTNPPSPVFQQAASGSGATAKFVVGASAWHVVWSVYCPSAAPFALTLTRFDSMNEHSVTVEPSRSYVATSGYYAVNQPGTYSFTGAFSAGQGTATNCSWTVSAVPDN
jgi:hypothetical protein